MSDSYTLPDMCLKSFVAGEREQTERLLEQVEEPKLLQDEEKGGTLLHWASRWGWYETVKELVEHYHFDPLVRSNNGSVPLLNACFGGCLKTIQYLIEQCKCDPMLKCNDGWTPLHFACAGGNVNVVKYLITQYGCDPMCKTDSGQTPLHFLCLNSGNLDVLSYLVNECNCDPMSQSNNGSTPLHSACSGGNVNVVKYLITQCRCDPMCKANNGWTPLHSVCHNSGNLDVICYLIEECKCDPMYTTNCWETPLHFACDKGHYAVAEYLLCTGNVNPASRNIFFKSPERFAIEKNELKVLFTKFSHLDSCLKIESYINMFMLGDSGVGKSTLTEVIKQRSQGGFWLGEYRWVSGVEPLTAGIMPHRLEHKELGNIILHDLAGQPEYYSSHIAVLENITQSSAAVFIVVVKLSEEAPYRWLSLVKDLSCKCSSTYYVLTIASHADSVEGGEVRRRELAQELEGKISSFLMNSGSLQNMGIVYLDCRTLDSRQFSVFKKSLLSACESIQSTIPLKKLHIQDRMYCQMLYSLMDSKGQSIYEVTELLRIVRESANEYYLPESRDKLLVCLSHLHCTGLIMLLNTQGGPWVIFKKQYLLSEVNGKIFDSNTSKKIEQLASNTGIISQECLHDLFPHYDSEMLIRFLLSMKLCERITPEMIAKTNLSKNNGNYDGKGELLFFPSLMSSSLHEENSTIMNKPFKFGWYLQCSNEHSFFSSRFLHLLTLRLAYQYALQKSTDNPHNLRCTIWSTGILWNDEDGVETLVELLDNSQSVILLMSSQKELEHNMIPLRRRVITDILSIREEICPSVHVKEYIIDSSQLDYPIDKTSSLVLYDIGEIASCIAFNKPCVVSCMKTNQGVYVSKKLSDLLPLEYNRGQDISIFVGRDIKLPGGLKLPNTVLSSPVDILRKHSATIQDVVSDPERLASTLHSAELISFSVKEEVVTTLGLSRYRKASIVVNEVERNISGLNKMEKFCRLCEVMKEQRHEPLSEIVIMMEKEVDLLHDKIKEE